VTSLGLAGCGAASATGPGEGATPASPGADSDGSAPADAGPTTTTTVALGSGGSGEGSKLTSTSSEATDSAGDGGAKGPRSSEVGRGTKDIQAIVVARRDDARACYDAAVKAHPGIEGNLDIRWTIDPKGNVTDIAVDTSHSDILEPTVGNCVIALIKKIHFNESAKGFETRTHYPFNFHPRAGGTMAGRPDAGGH
jgi:outer membrane biosynthesis protein TonB